MVVVLSVMGTARGVPPDNGARPGGRLAPNSGRVGCLTVLPPGTPLEPLTECAEAMGLAQDRELPQSLPSTIVGAEAGRALTAIEPRVVVTPFPGTRDPSLARR